MLQHLSSLRASVAGLCPVYHPWVRHMANQDRWIIRINDEGNPESVVLVPAVDAKLLVTIAKDNHNSFPDFRGHSLPLRFAKYLLDIYTDGPMARLLVSVVRIKDQDSWWADVEKLIQHAAVEDKYKDTQTFGLDVAEVSCLSWKWRRRSSVKIAERTYEKGAQALHG